MAYLNNIPNYYPSAVPYGNNFNNIQPSNTFIWTKNIKEESKTYPVGPGQSVLLIDKDAMIFCIKSADQSGMPLPMKCFSFKELIDEEQAKKNENYITKEEFEEFKNNLYSQLKSQNNAYKPKYPKKEE